MKSNTNSVDQTRPKVITLVAALVAFWLPVVVFSKIAGEVLERRPILLDNHILHWIHAQSTPFLDSFFLFITTLGNVEVILPVALLIMALLWYKHNTHAALLVLFGFFGAGAANFILKLLFHRQRPSFWRSAITETGYSFPSGHAMLSSALALSVIAVLWNTRWRWLAIPIAAPLVLLIGLSRLYMGVHYPTDIIAGWSASFVWVMIVVFIARRYKL